MGFRTNIMTSRPASIGLRLLLLLALTAVPAPLSAQQEDMKTTVRRYTDLFKAGDYAAALVEALKLEAAVKAKLGEDNLICTSALTNTGDVLDKLGKYAEAETFNSVSAFAAALPLRAQGKTCVWTDG